MTLEQTISILRQREVPYYEGSREYRYVDYDEEGPHLANVLDLDRDENKLYSAILSTFPPEDLLKKEEDLSGTDCSGFLLSKMRWAASDHAPVKTRFRNESIGTLLKLFLDKRSKCVSYARQALRTRYPYQSFAVQKRILLTFLEDGAKEDVSWAGRTLRDDWIPGFAELVVRKWKESRVPALAYTILRHLPAEVVMADQEALASATSYAYVAARIGNEPGFTLDPSRLSVPDYFYVTVKLGRSMGEEEAIAELGSYFSSVPGVVYCYRDAHGRNEPQLCDIPGVPIIIWALGKLGLREPLLRLLDIKSLLRERFREMAAEDRWPALTSTLRCRFNPGQDSGKVFLEEKLKFQSGDAAMDDDLPVDDMPPCTSPDFPIEF